MWYSFATSAYVTPLTTVTSAGGKMSFTITLYLLTRCSEPFFLHTYGLQSIVNIHAHAVTATPLGFRADGYAGDKLRNWILWYWLFNEQDDIVQVFTEGEHYFATRVGGNPESMLKLSDTSHVHPCR